MKVRKIFTSLLVGTWLLCWNICTAYVSQPTEVTVFNSKTNTLSGPSNELQLVNSFPIENYDICCIPKIGAFYVDKIEDIIKNDLRQGVAWEPKTVGCIEHFVVPGTVAVDIGAHIGTHTLSLSRCVGDSGRVVSFEPQMKIYREHVMNLKLNKCSNVEVYRCAIGNTRGTVQMMPSSWKNEGGTGIGSGGDYVFIKTLDDFNLKNISFIKIDVENRELDVLRGMKETIACNRPVILLEIMGNRELAPPDPIKCKIDTIQLLQSMNYVVQHYDCADYIAIPSEKYENLNS